MTTENRKLLSFEDVDLYLCDVQPLTVSGGWLTDNTMNFGACYLMKKFSEMNPAIKDKVCIVYASVCELIKYSTGDDETELYSSVGLSPDKWALIIYSDSSEPGSAFSGSHWCLLLFDPTKKKFWLFDSMPGSKTMSPEFVLSNSALIPFVKKLQNYLGVPDDMPGRALVNIFEPCPKMNLSGDCGIFTIEYIHAILAVLSQNLNADSETDFRGAISAITVQGVHEERRNWLLRIADLHERGQEEEEED